MSVQCRHIVRPSAVLAIFATLTLTLGNIDSDVGFGFMRLSVFDFGALYCGLPERPQRKNPRSHHLKFASYPQRHYASSVIRCRRGVTYVSRDHVVTGGGTC